GRWFLRGAWRAGRWIVPRGRATKTRPVRQPAGDEPASDADDDPDAAEETDSKDESGSRPEGSDIPISDPKQLPLAEVDSSSAPALLPIVRPAPVPEEERFAGYELPPLSLLEEPQPFPYEQHDQQLRERAALLEKTFTDFGLNVRVVGINTGPVITQYEV